MPAQALLKNDIVHYEQRQEDGCYIKLNMINHSSLRDALTLQENAFTYTTDYITLKEAPTGGETLREHLFTNCLNIFSVVIDWTTFRTVSHQSVGVSLYCVLALLLTWMNMLWRRLTLVRITSP